MELQEIWKQLDAQKLNQPVSGAIRVSKTSRHPVQKLKELYLLTIGLSVVFLIGFIALFFLYDGWLTRLCLSLVAWGYAFFLTTNISSYRKISAHLPVDKSLREALVFTHDYVTSNILFQERAALWIYPVAGAAGFLMGGASALGNFEILFTHHVILPAILGVILLIITPLCFFTARWLNTLFYGGILKQLHNLIQELDRVD